MAPGPRKKNIKRGTPEIPPDKKNVKSNPETNKRSVAHEKHVESSDSVNDELQNDAKSSLSSNWDRYEEPKHDPLADIMRGDDFDVMLSYAGGSSSHLQLQEEKDWDEAFVNENNLVLDLQDLISAVKCVPFHKLINLSEDIFDETQIAKFISSSESWKLVYNKNRVFPLSKDKPKESTEIGTDLNILENTEESDTEEMPTKKYGIEENTETIIDSLTSCLSLKSWAKESFNDKIEEKKENPPTQSDDLDFLLSLSIPSKSDNTVLDSEVKVAPKTTSVDDWLSSILDD